MADIFGSLKRPSLFPVTVTMPSISKEEYLIFYKNERSLFTLLLVNLHREVLQSILVVGFLLWLEREGYTSNNLVKTMVSSLSYDEIDRVADEVVMCLKFLEKNFILEGDNGILMLQSFLDRKRINLEEIYRDRDLISGEVCSIANEVSGKAFDDILERQRNSVLKLQLCSRNHAQEEEIAPENRTIFLTFSKGYPISEIEVRHYFTGMFGDFIDSIYMQPVEPENQPLFARIVARSPSMVRAVVDKDGRVDGKSKYYINGKHVWARKYVKRTSSRDTGEGVASPH